MALLGLGLLLLSATLPSGPPPDALGRRAWDGLGPRLDARLPGQGWVEHARVVRAEGREERVVLRARVGHELVVCALYLSWLPLGLLVLRRAGGVPTLRPRLRDLDALLTALAVLVPGGLAIGLGAALLAARLGDGSGLRAEVYRFCLPTLGDPRSAPWAVLRLIVLAPLAEELLWRGVVFRGLRARLALAPAAVTTALGFALWHWLAGWQALGPLGAQYVFGLTACLLVERTGGLFAPIALHALGNAAALVLYAVCMGWPEHLIGALGG